jgi:hypothetical protein
MAKFRFLREASRMVGVHVGELLGLILGMSFYGIYVAWESKRRRD